MDLTQTIIAKSDQLNADDLVGGPQTFTVTDVRMGDSEQPVSIVLAEWPEGRPFKPSKTVLRILVLAWGKESDDWPKGARMTLYRDEKVKWAGTEVGGIRVSHLSHIKSPLKVALAESKGKKKLHTVQPLPDAPLAEPARMSVDYVSEVEAAKTDTELRAIWKQAKEAGELTDPLAAKITAAADKLAGPQAEPDADADEQQMILDAERDEAGL
jgi:hypothetical protein